jgi:hypothetical protein
MVGIDLTGVKADRLVNVGGGLGEKRTSIEGDLTGPDLRAAILEIRFVQLSGDLTMQRVVAKQAVVHFSGPPTSLYSEPKQIDFSYSTFDSLDIDPPQGSDLKLVSSSFGELGIGSIYRENATNINSVDLSNATVKGSLRAIGIVADDLNAAYLVVNGPANLSAVDAKRATFNSATFNALQWTSHGLPKEPDLVSLAFRTLFVGSLASVGGSKKSSAVLPDDNLTKHFLETGTFSQSAFAAYEAQLRSQGLAQESDRIFFAMHEKRRKLDWTLKKWPHALLDLLQEYFIGYGRSVTIPLVWSLGFVVGGILIFAKGGTMEPKVENPSAFSPLWYSLELFLPVVDLGMAKEWRPKPLPAWRVAYARLHQLAGWVLVPVALAAITGVLK